MNFEEFIKTLNEIRDQLIEEYSGKNIKVKSFLLESFDNGFHSSFKIENGFNKNENKKRKIKEKIKKKRK